MHYPIVIYPAYYYESKREPIYKSNSFIYTEIPQKIEVTFLPKSIAVSLLIAFIYSLYDKEGFWWIVSIGVIIGILGTYTIMQDNKHVKEENDKNKEKFERLSKQPYEPHAENYARKINFIERKNKFTNIVANNLSDQIDRKIKVGRAENFFLKHLISNENFVVVSSLKFGFYYPDIVLVRKEHKTIFNIEIDEAYDFDTYEPFHLVGSDDIRNNYFSNAGFIVVRFREDQIIKNPTACIELLEDISKTFVTFNDYNTSNKLYQKLKSDVYTEDIILKLISENHRKLIYKVI